MLSPFLHSPRPLSGLSIICPECLTLGNAPTLPQETVLQTSNFNEAEQRPNFCTVQYTSDLAMDVSCGIPQVLDHTSQSQLPSLASLSTQHTISWEGKANMKVNAFSETCVFNFLGVFFQFDVSCILLSLTNKAALLCINKAVQALNTCSGLA